MLANVDGIDLNAEQYRLYRAFSVRMNSLDGKSPAQIREIEQDLRREILDVPQSPLRPLVWGMVNTWVQLLDMDFAAQALAAYLSEQPSPVTAFTAFHEVMRLRPAGNPAMQRHLRTFLSAEQPRLEAERRAALEDALNRIEELLRLDEAASGPDASAAAWVQGWLLRTGSGFYTHYREADDFPQVPAATGLEVLRRLLALTPDDHRPAHNASEYERSSFLRF